MNDTVGIDSKQARKKEGERANGMDFRFDSFVAHRWLFL